MPAAAARNVQAPSVHVARTPIDAVLLVHGVGGCSVVVCARIGIPQARGMAWRFGLRGAHGLSRRFA